MRYVSQYPNYSIQVRPMRVRAMGDGTSQTLTEPLYVKFTAVDQGAMLYERERWLADGHFRLHGFKQHQDEATPVDSIHRFSVLDTDEAAKAEGWTEEEKLLVEDTLTRKSITTPQALLFIEGKPIDPPFPSYDTYDGDLQSLVMLLVELGHDLEHVKAYEVAFGPNRPDFVEALDIGIGALKEQTVSA